MRAARRFLTLLVATLAVAVWAFFGLNLLLGSALARGRLSAELSRTLRAPVTVGALRFAGRTVELSEFAGRDLAGGRVVAVGVHGVRATLRWRDLLARRLPVRSVTVDRVDLVLTTPPGAGGRGGPAENAGRAGPTAPPSTPAPDQAAPPTAPPTTPGEAAAAPTPRIPTGLPDVRIRQLAVRWAPKHGAEGGLYVDGLRLKIRGDQVHARLGDGYGRYGPTVRFAWRGATADARIGDAVEVTATVRPQTGGSITLQGAVPRDGDAEGSAQLAWRDVNLAPIARYDWLREAFSSGTLVWRGVPKRAAQGSLHAQLQARDVWFDLRDYLDPLANRLGRRVSSSYRINTAGLDGHWRDGAFAVDRLTLDGGDATQAQGTGQVAAGQLSGTLHLGLNPAVVHLLPGADTGAFAEQRGGLAYASVNLTGPVRKPREDLSGRLLADARDDLQNRVKAQFGDTLEILGRLLRQEHAPR